MKRTKKVTKLKKREKTDLPDKKSSRTICTNFECTLRKAGCTGFAGCPGYKGK
jgi:hypothetical protein